VGRDPRLSFKAGNHRSQGTVLQFQAALDAIDPVALGLDQVRQFFRQPGLAHAGGGASDGNAGLAGQYFSP